MSKKTDKNKNKSVSQYELGAADLEKVSGGVVAQDFSSETKPTSEQYVQPNVAFWSGKPKQ